MKTTGQSHLAHRLRGPALAWSILILAATYFAAAKLGLTMAFVADQVTAVWPPTGIALGAVILLGPGVWPGILLGAFLANVTTNTSVATALGIAIGNTLEAVTGAWLLRKRADFDPSLQRLKDVIAFVTLAVVLSPIVSATIGVASLCLGGVQPWSAYRGLWSVWWLGDATGALVVAPVLLAWFGSRRSEWSLTRSAEAFALLGCGVFATALVFMGLFSLETAAHPLVYLIFPFIIWAALRFGQIGTTAITLAASSVAILGTTQGLGPFARGAVNESLILLQLFMAVVAVTGLFLGAAVAESKRAETTLRDANRHKDEFLAMLSHELRNPLAAIASAAQLLRRSEKREHVIWSTDTIQRQITVLARMIDDLLDVSRITRGIVQLRKAPVTVTSIMDSVIQSVKPFVEERQHRFTTVIETGAVLVNGDPTRLEQVFVNLLTNAAKFTEPGGQIELRAGVFGESVIISVRDTGLGMSPELLARAFDLFVQGDRSLARSEGGLGIGLSLVKHLVEMHGGSVSARSDGPGKGTEFIVTLPAAGEAPVAEDSPGPAASRG